MIELSSELLRLRKFLIMFHDTHASVILYLGSEKVSGVHFAEIKFPDVPRDYPLRPRGAGQ